jgi:glycosyltransferase involved in cell wall biosynthesis
LPAHLGAAAARNAGVARARGEVIAFLDDDDVWLKEKIARQLPVLLAAGPDVAAVTCAAELRSEEGRVTVVAPSRDLSRLLLWQCPVAPSTVVLRRSAFEAVGGFDESLTRIEDWDMWLRLTDHHEFAVIPDVLVQRAVTDLPTDVGLHYALLAEDRLSERIDRLPARERRAVRAKHRLAQGVYLARLGEHRRARRALGEAWRLNPATVRPLVHLARPWVGEKAWQAVRRGRDRIREAIVARRGSRPGQPGGSRPR